MNASKEGTIIINDLILHARLGWTSEERSSPQRILLSVKLTVNTAEAAATRNLDHTVCYSALSEMYHELIKSKEWVLLEELAESVCQFTLGNFSRVDSVSLRLKKFALPDAAWVGVEITRKRQEACA
jgi:FolB domain-containing protein